VLLDVLSEKLITPLSSLGVSLWQYSRRALHAHIHQGGRNATRFKICKQHFLIPCTSQRGTRRTAPQQQRPTLRRSVTCIAFVGSFSLDICFAFLFLLLSCLFACCCSLLARCTQAAPLHTHMCVHQDSHTLKKKSRRERKGGLQRQPTAADSLHQNKSPKKKNKKSTTETGKGRDGSKSAAPTNPRARTHRCAAAGQCTPSSFLLRFSLSHSLLVASLPRSYAPFQWCRCTSCRTRSSYSFTSRRYTL
jgi:hypothetical protein